MTNRTIEVYTDGCCLRNPGGAGGYGVLVLSGGQIIKESYKGFRETTNNRMEIMAAIAGVESLEVGAQAKVYSDSQYLVRAMMQGWLGKWKRNGWITKASTPVKNQDLWERLDAARNIRRLTFVWVRGHNGHAHNEHCDQLASRAARHNPIHEDNGFAAT